MYRISLNDLQQIEKLESLNTKGKYNIFNFKTKFSPTRIYPYVIRDISVKKQTKEYAIFFMNSDKIYVGIQPVS